MDRKKDGAAPPTGQAILLLRCRVHPTPACDGTSWIVVRSPGFAVAQIRRALGWQS
jgi:hypothetical protein